MKNLYWFFFPLQLASLNFSHDFPEQWPSVLFAELGLALG